MRAERHKYSLDEKTKLGELCRKYKIEYESEKQQQPSNNCNPKKRKHCQTLPSTGWASRAVREFYADLKEEPNSSQLFRSAKCLAERCLHMVLKADRDPKPTKTKFRQPGGGRTVKVQEVRYELYSWFVDIRFSLKARLPVNVFP